MILLIDNYDSFTYNLLQQIASIYSNVKVVRNDKITLQKISQLAPKLIILSPGPGRPEDAGLCIPIIKYFYQSIPIIGICLGHQAIGAAFNSEIINANEIIHGKQTAIFHYNKDIFHNFSQPFMAARYHSLVISEHTIADCLDVLAESGNGSIMAIKHREYPVYGLQFHPESILTAVGNEIMQRLLQQCIGESLC